MEVAIVEGYTTDLQKLVDESPFASMPDASKALEQYIKSSDEVWYGMADGKIACVWGLVPPTMISNRAYLWLFHTNIVAEHKFLFIRKSQLVIHEALKKWSVIVGHVEAGNYSAKRWLKWLGAEFGPTDGKLIPFRIKRK